MKKKIITLCLVIALLSVAVIGGTLAYFTDVDQATNEFTVGGVTIDLWEEVDHKDAVGNEKDNNKDNIILGQGSDEYQEFLYTAVMPGDVLTKKVTVENTDSEAAYIALAIQQNNYGIGGISAAEKAASTDFNNRIDDYYEGNTPLAEVQKYMQETKGYKYGGTEMQALISGIFTGSGWNNLSYTKLVNGVAKDEGALAPKSDVRYYPTNLPADRDQDGSESYIGVSEPTLIAVDYSVAKQGKHSENMLDKTIYDKCENGTRIWVYYIYLPAKNIDPETGKNLSSYTLDLTITVPTQIDEYSIEAFENMVLDFRASAIQVSGFASAKAAFEALEKVYDYNYTCYVGCTET
ncbi:MAG: SipW-dependent-type signal peptide-containing protein, partial [Oscillospiraceae bacterium]|nr:SipW-dependent-type signal peptide-containing protein [Oscillospiraceae bacterium]